MSSTDGSLLLDGAAMMSLPPQQLLGLYPSRVYLDPPACGSHLRQVGFISAPTSYQLPSPGLPSSWLSLELLLALPLLGPFAIFTDGSWTPTGPSHSHVTANLPTFHGSAGVVIISDLPNWRDLPILTFQVDNGQDMGAISAYSMEVLGILVGLSIGTQLPATDVTICSDCQAAVRKLEKNRYRARALRTKTRDSSLLELAISLWNSSANHLSLKWVKGHPEKEKADTSLWTREMWGNHLADRAAAGVLTSSFY